jgi:hypothetical protein
LTGAPALPQQKTRNAQQRRRHKALMRRRLQRLLYQYCYDTVEKGITGGSHSQWKPLVDRVIKMHKLLSLKSRIYIDDMWEWSGW